VRNLLRRNTYSGDWEGGGAAKNLESECFQALSARHFAIFRLGRRCGVGKWDILWLCNRYEKLAGLCSVRLEVL
jgi:hypothetical protein